MYILHFAYPFLYWWTLASHVVIWTCLSICFLSISSPSFGSWLRSLSRFFLHCCAISLKLLHWLYVARISHSVRFSQLAPLHFVGLHYSISLVTLTFMCSTHPLWWHREQLWAGAGFQMRSPRMRHLWLGWWVSLGCFSCFMSHLGLLQLKLTRQL